MDNQIQEVKNRLDIVSYIGERITLQKAGRNFRALCPFHQEKSPSFMVSPERQRWHCFGACHEGGDIIQFAMKWENITFYEALKELAASAGVQLADVSFQDQKWQEKERFVRINDLAARYFAYVLTSHEAAEVARSYLKQRGLSDKVIKTFQLGYAPKSWDSLRRFFEKRNVSDSDAIASGLVVKSSSGRIYDRFRGRIMFPIKDMRGTIVGFSGRILEPTEKDAKYINTPETMLYHKRESLYGIHLAKDAIRSMRNAILVEGEFDMISPYLHGVDNIVAIKGSAVTKEQLSILKRFTNRITLALDADEAGEDALLRGIQEAEKQEFEIEVLPIANAKDPDEMARSDIAGFKRALSHTIPVYDHIIALAQKKFEHEGAFGKKKIGDQVVPFIARIQNPIVQSHYVKKLALLLEVEDEAVHAAIRSHSSRRKSRSFTRPKIEKKSEIDREQMLAQYVLSSLFQHDEPYTLADVMAETIESADFAKPAYAKLYDHFLQFRDTHRTTFTRADFEASIPQELVSAYDELFLYDAPGKPQVDGGISRSIYHFKRLVLDRLIGEVSKLDESPEKDERLQSYNKLRSAVEKKLHTV